MIIKRVSILDGVERAMDLPVTAKQLNDWASGTVIQRAMPHLNSDEREFLMTGITPDQWDKEFSDAV